ncbi:MAG: sodium:proton antiporter [Ignavibacteria bacterium]|jgi:Na+/H+ antiporter NhaD/arsenite permease-like protein|nr:sodium:proton antiporter [Ignavibacteria bacterium]MCU7503275.1 sodium:proton antiporter [Ignavibacteria bacterium]MCU7515779.1 sodium:proton antiporter [Ignavibacteria bacterium]
MENTGLQVPLLALVPFVLMLASIAVFPLFLSRFWDKNRNKLAVAALLSLPIIIYLVGAGAYEKLLETVFFDYIPFIILLGSLFTITGGIYLTGDIEAKPVINTLFLGIGALLASFMGTTGAAMLLIRPVIQTNKEREYKVHTILFFIGIVANCGGLLTPLGDPPLFMMYLRGASFSWFFSLFPEWLVTNLLLLIIYYFVDSYYHKKEKPERVRLDRTNIRPIKIQGKLNFIWLLGVVLAVAFVNEQYIGLINSNAHFRFLREAVILLMALLSLLFTPRLVRVSNNFTWGPIQEVAYLFIGIFITMVPCLLYLQENARHLGVDAPMQFYYASGALSSVLDNTPTAVTFHSLALGLGHIPEVAGIPSIILRAICIGAVFFGSLTYIGNGPNFMVKSVAEENNIKMPDFFSYIFKFSLIVLLPVFILIQWLFL